MLYNYIALVFFIIFGLFIPAAFLLTAKMLGQRVPGNPVKNAPWESSEESIGSSRDVENEYLPYFMLFLPFELVIIVLILWSTIAGEFSMNLSLAIIGLGVIASALSIIGYKFASGSNG